MKPAFGRRRNEHPAPSSLLLAIEGELSPKEELAVNQHLQKCWECRAQSEKIRDGILDYMTYHDRLAKTMEPPPGAWSGFPYRLHNAEAEYSAPGPARLRNLARSLAAMRGRFPSMAGGFVLAAAVLGCVVYFAFIRLVHPPAVSANEVLRLAVQAHLAERDLSGRPPARRRLAIKHGNHLVTRDVLQGTAAAARNQEDEDLQRVFARSGWNWADPLDPQSFARWRDSLAAREDRVRSASQEVTITTVASGASSVLEASLTVRAADWHPIGEQLRLDDQSRVEITELPAEEGSSGPSLASSEGGAAAGEAVSGTPSAATPGVVLPAPTVDDATLAKAELQARVALHQVGADLGEQIEVHRAGAQVVVKGLANTRERKQQIETALLGIANVRTSLDSIAEMRLARAPAAAAVVVATDPQPPLLRDLLLNDFHDEAERQHFVESALSSGQAALMRAWALRRLAEHYTPEELARLDAGSRQALQSLLSDHLASMRRELDDLHGRWSPLLPAFHPVPESGAPSSDWQAKVLRLFPAIQGADQLSTWGLAADGSGLDSPTLLRKLAGNLADAQTWLDRLSAQIARSDWEQPRP